MPGRRLGGLGVAATAVACPCHVVTGLVLGGVALVGGAAPALTPELQDGVHALYVPAAVLLAARLLGGRLPRRGRAPTVREPAAAPAAGVGRA